MALFPWLEEPAAQMGACAEACQVDGSALVGQRAEKSEGLRRQPGAILASENRGPARPRRQPARRQMIGRGRAVEEEDRIIWFHIGRLQQRLAGRIHPGEEAIDIPNIAPTQGLPVGAHSVQVAEGHGEQHG